MTLKLTRPRLSADLRSLCGRVANERCKAATWAEARRLREFAQQRMNDGENVVQVTNWLAQELTAAVAAQREG
jgi:hypothetical protein